MRTTTFLEKSSSGTIKIKSNNLKVMCTNKLKGLNRIVKIDQYQVFCNGYNASTLFQILFKGYLTCSIVSLYEHRTHYDPWSEFPFFNLDDHSLRGHSLSVTWVCAGQLCGLSCKNCPQYPEHVI